MYASQEVALDGDSVAVADESNSCLEVEGSEQVDGAVVEESDVFLLSVALVEPARSMKKGVKV